MRTKAVILAGGKGTRLASLTQKRAKPAVPFAGKYRIIDFALSNCVNSNITDVLVLTQYRPHSLNDHIGKGRPWDLDRSFTGGVQMLQPYKGSSDTDWYVGTADAVAQNINFIRRGQPDYVLILSGDHIYQMDYDMLVNFHRDNGADLTICTIRVPIEEASRFGILDVDENMQVKKFIEKPKNPPGNLASMGVYVFSYAALEEAVLADQKISGSKRDFGKDVIPRLLENKAKVYAYPYGGYWIDVGTIEAFWEAHMDLLQYPPALNLNDRTWVIHTQSEERPPVRMMHESRVSDSLITDGCVIANGAVVENSVLSAGVYVGPGAVVRNSVILTDAYIEANATVERAIIDKIAVIGEGAKVGSSNYTGSEGITCVGKNTLVPPYFTIGGGCILGTDLKRESYAAYPNKIVPDGTMLGYTVVKD
jgi:glucose-1-phosphate adenylyltransferase